jgi:peptide/nickel transport system permease protein
VRVLARHRAAGLAMAFLVLMAVLALAADVLAPFDALQQGVGPRLAPPQPDWWMGTDTLGRDVLSRIIYGARTSLYVSVASVGFGISVGAALGITSGYVGGWLDLCLQRLVDSMMAFPALVLALLLVTFLGSGINQSVVAIAFVIIPSCARLVRGSALACKEYPYVESARVAGASGLRIVRQHILPNVMAPILVITTIWLGNAIIIEATLSFLGLGAPPPAPSWGNMLSSAALQYMEIAPWLAVFPGLVIGAVVLAFNLLGDALRDQWDPWLRTRQAQS